MESNGIVPDGFTYSIMFDEHSRCGNLDASMELLEGTVKKGIQISAYTCSVLVSGLCKAGKITEAQNVLKRLMQSWRRVLLQPRAESMETALLVVEEMEANVEKASRITYNSLLNGYFKMQKVASAEKVFAEMTQKGWTPDRRCDVQHLVRWSW
ncbi:Pentatricopeptide repeat-containing protein [Nymphaea thermarum]|nr:Pentatricopeptide repeat-containing protein [Nymphaea thermarum]